MFGDKEQSNEYNSTPSDSVFDRVASAEGQEGSVFIVPGVYPVLGIDVLKMIRSRKGDDLFIAELEIIESDVPERPQGSRMAWMANFRHDPTPSAVKTFLARVMGVPPEEVDAAGSRLAVGEQQPCRGRLIRLEATQIETKSGNPFTKCTWRELPDNLQEQAKELRSNAGFPPF